MRRMVFIFLCIAGAMLNIAINRLCILVNVPLYLDTIMTVSVTLAGGLFWGVLCGALTNLVHHSIWFWGWEGYLFTFCNIATAFVTWLFIRLFPRELSFDSETREAAASMKLKSSRLNLVMGRVIVLLLLSFALCLAMSILGGSLTALILGLNPSHSGERGLSVFLSATMFGSHLPVILAEIFSRIPINIIDRLVSVFGAYGIALAIHGILTGRSGNRQGFS